MPNLDFAVTSVKPASHGIAPLLNFRLRINNQPPEEHIHNVILHAQIQIHAPRREYSESEKEKLVELFGAPAQWGKTLRNRLWTNTHTVVGGFAGETEAELQVPCSYDLNITATKYFYGLEGGDAALLFLFSGTVYYQGPEGRLQVQQISWDKESAFRMPAQVWLEMMEQHFPNRAWVYLNRDIFERRYAYKRSNGLTSWDQAIEQLLPAPKGEEVLA